MLGRFISADSVVPGAPDGSLDGVALKPLTVDFHETGFVNGLNAEHGQGFWFQNTDQIAPWGPQQPQALNRYSYVQNNPLKYTDPTGHVPDPPILITNEIEALGVLLALQALLTEYGINVNIEQKLTAGGELKGVKVSFEYKEGSDKARQRMGDKNYTFAVQLIAFLEKYINALAEGQNFFPAVWVQMNAYAQGVELSFGGCLNPACTRRQETYNTGYIGPAPCYIIFTCGKDLKWIGLRLYRAVENGIEKPWYVGPSPGT